MSGFSQRTTTRPSPTKTIQFSLSGQVYSVLHVIYRGENTSGQTGSYQFLLHPVFVVIILLYRIHCRLFLWRDDVQETNKQNIPQKSLIGKSVTCL